MKKIILIILFLTISVSASAVTSTKFIQKFEEWELFKKTTQNEHHCIIISHPESSAGFPGFRDKPYISFTTVKGGKFTFSIYSGFILNKNEPIQVFIEDNIFFLKIFRNFFAYTYDSNDDEKLLRAIKESKGLMRVRTVNNEMAVANDYYAIKGLSHGLNFMLNSSHCN